MILAAAESLAVPRHFVSAYSVGDPEQVRDAKAAVRALINGGRYQETADQARLCGVLSLDEARERCRWYRKLESDLAGVLRA
jgi:hypothetical protein